MKKIYIFRHGETEFNKLGIMQGRSIDIGLNNHGKEQAKSFFYYYNHIPFELIISSELKRSREIIGMFINKGIPHIIDERITEISWGANEGQPMGEDTKQRFKKMINEWAKGNLEYSIPGGETGVSLVTRIDSFIEMLKQRQEKFILINTHGRALKMLVTRLLQQDISMMEKYKHHNTGLYLFEQKNNKFSLIKENDISHLENRKINDL